jgi:hypothetical protein
MNEGDQRTLAYMGVRMSYFNELISYHQMGYLPIENEIEHRIDPGCSNITLILHNTDCDYGHSGMRIDESESHLIRTYVVGISMKGGGGKNDKQFFIDLVYQFILSDYACYYALKTRLVYHFVYGDIIPTLFNRSVPFVVVLGYQGLTRVN